MASSPKHSCSDFHANKFSIYDLVFANQLIESTLRDGSKPISIFTQVLYVYLETIMDSIIAKQLDKKDQFTISLSKSAILIDTSYPDIKTTIPHIHELFDDATEQAKKEMLSDFLGSCQLDLSTICDMEVMRYYFIFLVNRTSTPVKIMFLGYHKMESDSPKHVFVANLIRTEKDHISTVHSQAKKKEVSLYRNKVVLLPI